MTQPTHFLQAVLEHPRDDQPRLDYAHWLDERCDPRGEFIRVQCLLGALPANNREVLELETRQRELLAEFEASWVGRIAELADWWVFRRGFIEEIAISSARFIEHGDELFRLAPIRAVHFRTIRQTLEPLIGSSTLEKTAYVDLSSNPVRDQGARLLAKSPHLSRVRGLNLTSSGIGDAGIKALAESPHLVGLRELYLCDNYISARGARDFADSPLAQRLDVVYLRCNVLGHDGAELLQRRLGAKVHL